MTADRGGRGARTEPRSEEPARAAPGPEGLKFRELPYRFEEDEINLVDLWLVLVRRRFVFITVATGCVLGGLLFAFLPSPKYSYTTAIEIGTRVVNQEIRLLESTEMVLAKIENGYIPLALLEFEKNNPDDKVIYGIDATTPKNSRLIVLKGKGPLEQESTYTELHNNVAGYLQKDHGRIVDVLRKKLAANLTKNENKLADLQGVKRLLETKLERLKAEHTNKLADLREEGQVIQARLRRIDKTESLLVKQMEGVTDLIVTAERQRTRAVSEVTDEARAMTLLMISNELHQNRTRLASLQERAEIGLPNKRDDLAKSLEDNRREQANRRAQMANAEDDLAKRLEDNQRGQDNQRDLLDILQLQLSNLLNTRTLVPPMPSLKPIGPGRAAILALAGVLGVILGIFAAFFAEFLTKARAAMAKDETTAAHEPVVRGE